MCFKFTGEREGYVKPTTPKPTTPKPTPRVPRKRSCPALPISTIYYNPYARHIILLTDSDQTYYVKPTGGIKYGPQKTGRNFRKNKLPGKIDAAFSLSRDISRKMFTIVFSGTK